MARWVKGERAVQFLVDRNRLESFAGGDLAALAEALIGRAVLRVETTAAAALAGGDGSHMAVEDAVSAQFKEDVPAFAKPTFERLRRARHSAQYFDPSAPPLTASDAAWAIEKAKEALSGVKALLAASPPERFG